MENNSKKIITILSDHRLRNTKVRRDVLSLFVEKQEALSHQFIEQEIHELDRITLYRTLRTFEKNGIIHKAIDGSEKAKYALCIDGCTDHHHEDEHAHFHCDRCNRTFCLEEVIIPPIQVPQGYHINSTYLVLNGLCKQCLASM